MLKTWVDNVQVMHVADNKFEQKNGGDPIVFKTCCFYTDMQTYTMTIDKPCVPKIKDGMNGRILLGWDTETKNGFTKYKPKIYDFNEIKK